MDADEEPDISLRPSQEAGQDGEEWRAGREIIRSSRGDIASEIVVSKEGTYVEILNDPLLRTATERVSLPITTDSQGVLTNQEYKDLQRVADNYQTSLYIIGSRAKGEGRRIEQAELPVGKDKDGKITRSDIDVLVSGQAVIDSGGYLADAIKEIGDGTANVHALPGIREIPNERPYLRIGPQLPSQAESVELNAAPSELVLGDAGNQVASPSESGQAASLVLVEEASRTEGPPPQTQEIQAEKEAQQEAGHLEEEQPPQTNVSLAETSTVENRLETLAQEATETRAFADQKTIELEQAQTLADEKARVSERTATAAAERIERLEYSTQLLKDEARNLPPNVAEVNERLCAEHQVEIAELNAEIVRVAAEAEAAKEVAENALSEKQEAEAKALAAEKALKEEKAHRQEEEKALEEQQAQKAEETVQHKEEEAEQAEQQAHQKAQEAQQSEEIAEKKEAEALEAEEIAQQKAKEAEKAEEIALEKEGEAQKAEEAVKQAKEEELEAKEIQEAEDLSKQKAIEAEEARAAANQKAEEAKEAEAFAKQKAEEASEAREDASLKAEEAQQAEAVAEEKAIEAQQARAALPEDATIEGVPTEEKAAAREITANQAEQTNENPLLAEEASLAAMEGTEAAQTPQDNVQENAVVDEAASNVAQPEEGEGTLHEEEATELAAQEENAAIDQLSGESMEASQLEASDQQQTAGTDQAVDAIEQLDATVDLVDAVEQDASVMAVEAAQGVEQENGIVDQALPEEAKAELPTGASHEEGAEEALQLDDNAAVSQLAQEEPTELASQGDPPIATDKNEVLESLERETDGEEETPSGSQNEGRGSNQEEEPAVQQAVQQTVDESAKTATEMETSSAEAKQEDIKEDYAIAATQVVSMGMGTGSGSSGGASMCFFMPCFPPLSTGRRQWKNRLLGCDRHEFL